MLLSIPNRNLLITGSKSGKPPARGTASTSGSKYRSPTTGASTSVADAGASWTPKKATRRQRRLVPGRGDGVTKALQQILAALYKKDGLKNPTMTISKLPTKVTLVGMQTRGGALTFQINGSKVKRSYSLENLSTKDRAAISVAMAETLSNSADAQGLAGVFLEIAGYTADADEYFKKAGSTSKKKFDKLFK